jgi:hypothetical protein
MKALETPESTEPLATRVSDHAVPPDLVDAIRAPRGTQQVVTVYVGGEQVDAVIAGRGITDPEHETATWAYIQERVTRGTG